MLCAREFPGASSVAAAGVREGVVVAAADVGLWRPWGNATKDLEPSNDRGSLGGDGDFRANFPL